MNRILIIATKGYVAREETYNGRPHLAVPVVALVEGVIHAMNSDDDEFVAAQEFSKAPHGWNGKPIFYGHPLVNGRPVSGNAPTVLETNIGTVFNAGTKSRKLAMEAWIDVERAAATAPEILTRAKAGAPIEISVGVMTETDETPGVYGEHKYARAWKDIGPDHLALLPPHIPGACSNAMGCGVRYASAALRDAWPNKDGEDDHGRGSADKASMKAHQTGKAGDHVAAAHAHNAAADSHAKAGKAAHAAGHRAKAVSHFNMADKKAYGSRAAQEGSMYEEWLEPGPETDELLKVCRNITQEERDNLDVGDFAGPNQSFPIVIAGDVHDAAASLGRAKGNRDAIKKRIIAIAYRKGFDAQLPDGWKKQKDRQNAGLFARMMGMFRGAQPADKMGNNDLRRKLWEALREVEPNLSDVVDWFPVTDPAHVVYNCWQPSEAAGMEAGMGYQSTTWERSFDLDDSGVITLADSRIEVEPVLTYEPVEGASPEGAEIKDAAAGAPCSCHRHAPDNKESEMKKEDILAFVQNATPEELTALAAVAKPTPKADPAPAPVAEPVVAAAAAVVPEPKAEPIVAAAAPKTPTFEELLATAEPTMRDAIQEGARLGRERKASTIKALQDTGRCKMSAEELQGKTQAELDQLVELAGTNVRAAIDHSVNVPRDNQGEAGKGAPAAPDLNARILAAKK